MWLHSPSLLLRACNDIQKSPKHFMATIYMQIQCHYFKILINCHLFSPKVPFLRLFRLKIGIISHYEPLSIMNCLALFCGSIKAGNSSALTNLNKFNQNKLDRLGTYMWIYWKFLNRILDEEVCIFALMWFQSYT